MSKFFLESSSLANMGSDSWGLNTMGHLLWFSSNQLKWGGGWLSSKIFAFSTLISYLWTWTNNTIQTTITNYKMLSYLDLQNRCMSLRASVPGKGLDTGF
jgi:hypothetical protein